MIIAVENCSLSCGDSPCRSCARDRPVFEIHRWQDRPVSADHNGASERRRPLERYARLYALFRHPF